MAEPWELVVFGGTMLLMGYLTIRVAVAIIKTKSKAISAQQLMASLGFKNFNVKDLNVLTEEGFRRLLILVRELKPITAGGMHTELAQIMALAQSASVPGAVNPTTMGSGSVQRPLTYE